MRKLWRTRKGKKGVCAGLRLLCLVAETQVELGELRYFLGKTQRHIRRLPTSLYSTGVVDWAVTGKGRLVRIMKQVKQLMNREKWHYF